MTKEGFLTKEELLAEEHICNGKCQDDITKNYVHCKTCTRIKDFLAGYNTGFETCAKARLNVTTISDCPIKDDELEKENAGLKEKLTAIRNAKDKYDKSEDKSIIKALGAEYTLFCDLERILEDWQEDEQLTKAIELLKATLLMAQVEGLKGRYETVDEIEQFLSEVEA